MDNNEPEKEKDNIGSFYMGRMRPRQEPKRFLPPGVLTFVTLVALGGIVWYAYPRGAERYTDVDVPVVKADTAPIKETPDNPGGMDVPHQDSTAFDPLQKDGGAEPEKLMPAPEQPVDKDQAIKTVQEQMSVPPTAPPKLDMQVKKEDNGTEEIMPQAPEAKPPVTASTPAPQTTETKPPASAAITAPPEDAPAAKPAKAPAAAATSASGNLYEVQLGAYHTAEDANKDWAKLGKKFASDLGKLKMRLVKADIPGKGMYYRLQAGPVDKDQALALCATLKAANHGCIRANQ